MAYILTAVIVGGISALVTVITGGSLGSTFFNYVLYGHLGMVALGIIVVGNSIIGRAQTSLPKEA